MSRKSGTPIKLTGAQLVTLRLGLAHYLWENPDDDEMATVMRALPRPPLDSPRIHFDGVKVRTIRVAATEQDAYARAFQIAANVPHTATGCSKALRQRAEKLGEMSGVERLGKIV